MEPPPTGESKRKRVTCAAWDDPRRSNIHSLAIAFAAVAMIERTIAIETPTTGTHQMEGRQVRNRRVKAEIQILLTVVVSALIWFGAALPGFAQTPTGRSGFGNTHHPIWSELTFFERDSLSKLEDARSGDPDALLALYLIASNTRELADYRQVKARIDSFLKEFESQGLASDDPRVTGRHLNRHMHESFFLKDSRGFGPPGYDYEQSRLMGIFETGEYNCISSALLYAVMARELGLAVEGVMMPTHAFIQLNLPSGNPVDVETTSPGGFDQVHDQAYYDRQKQQADPNATIPPATYQDYQTRTRVSAAELAARNMLNQHTAAQLMDEDDIRRLSEIAAFIAPDYAQAQERRLYFYNREIQQLVAAGQWGTLERFFATTLQSISHAGEAFPQHMAIQTSLQHYRQGALVTYANLADTDKALGMIGHIMEHVTRYAEKREEAELRVSHAVGILLNKLAEQQAFDDGLLVLSLVEGYLQNPRAWPDMASWFYLRWSEYLWNDRDWPGVVDVLDDYIVSARASAGTQINETLTNAYYNWVVEALQNNDEAAAAGVVEQCQARHGQLVDCNKARKSLQAVGNSVL